MLQVYFMLHTAFQICAGLGKDVDIVRFTKMVTVMGKMAVNV